jgi:hypothetical protein
MAARIGRPPIDLKEQRFGRLRVIRRKPLSSGHGVLWVCRCDCGRRVAVLSFDLRAGKTRSCGCLRREVARATFTTHGLSDTPEYRAWAGAVKRCENPASKDFALYGGRGITVAADWRHDFAAFYRDIGPRPGPGHSLDRIDVNGNYKPGNVRWATPHQQRVNQRRSKVAA